MQFMAATGAAVGLSGVTTAEEHEPEQIVLLGPTDGWIGEEPEGIADETNPTLELEAGRTYEVVWTNADGAPHNFAIISADGEQLVRSPIIEESGAEQTVEFEATEEMSEYYCEVHPDTMRGEISVDGKQAAPKEPEATDDVPVAGSFPTGERVGLRKVATNLPGLTGFEYVEGQQDPNHYLVTQTGQVYAHRPNEAGQEAPEDETDEDAEEDEADGEDEEAADENAGSSNNQEFVFEGRARAWIGREPAEIEGEENPTLELVAGNQYTFTWENADGAPHNVAIRDGSGQTLESTEIIDEQGATQSLEFEATAEMVDYLCEVHPTTMLGDVEVVEEAESGDQSTDESNQTEEEEDDLEPIGEPGDPIEDDGEDSEEPGAATPDDLELFLDLSDRLVELGLEDLGGYDERGLLGLAFHPEYESNGRLYVRYSAPSREGTPEDYDHTDVLAEFRANDDGTVDLDSERTVLETPQPQDNHNGGAVEFGPDGYLYTSYGDGGNVHDIGLGHVEDWYDENEGGNAQDTEENLLGGILRIDVDADSGEGDAETADGTDEAEDEGDEAGNEGQSTEEEEEQSTEEEESTEENESTEEGESDDERPSEDEESGEDGETEEGEEAEDDPVPMETVDYGIPDDNPLVDEEGHHDEFFAWGFRNPWGMSIQDDGTVFVTDAGQHLYESAYIVENGGNYSWNVKEGSFCFSPETPIDPPEDCPDETPEDVRGGEPLRNPIAEYRHKRGTEAFIDSSVVVGGYRYDGEAIPELQGKYVFANWSSEGVVTADGELLTVTRPEAGDSGTADDSTEDDTGQDENGEGSGNGGGSGNGTGQDETGGDESGGGESVGPNPDRWTLEELALEGAENEKLNRYIYNVRRDEQGELYVLANTDYRPFPETGELYKVVPADEGEEVSAPEEPTTAGHGTGENGEGGDDGEGQGDEEEDGSNGESGTGEGGNGNGESGDSGGDDGY